ncbi:MAG TPA: MBL fold metallo-hydrolase [Chloroflexota bacterium]|nr:MBL fold metallo-hydrolase [Chloroflexota bacterium]
MTSVQTRCSGEVAPGIHWVEQSILDGKTGAVFGARGALAIDSGNSREDGAALAEVIRRGGHTPSRLALTHGHGDHAIGSSELPGAEVFAHARCPEVIRRHLPSMIKNQNRPNLEAELTWPSVTFLGELTIDLGGKTVRLVHTPGHSDDSICAYVVEDGVLFSGDTCVTIITPVVSDGHSAELEESLGRLSELGAEILVPGHGPIVTGRDAVRDALLWPARYVAAVRAHVRPLVARGDSDEAIVDATPHERFVGDRFEAVNPRGEKPHQLTVAKIVAEVRREGAAGGAPPDNGRTR